MRQTTLQFPSIIEMVDFQTTIEAKILYFNTTDLTLTAVFTEADIELAKEGYGATVVQAPEQ